VGLMEARFLRELKVDVEVREEGNGEDAEASRWIGSQIDEKSTVTDTATFFEVLLEEPSCLHVDTHRSENDREVVLMSIMDTLSGTRSAD